MNKTLSEYLDSIGAYKGDDKTFMLYENSFPRMRMQVSRRYLESSPLEYLLGYNVICTYNATDMYDRKILCIILEPEEIIA